MPIYNISITKKIAPNLNNNNENSISATNHSGESNDKMVNAGNNELANPSSNTSIFAQEAESSNSIVGSVKNSSEITNADIDKHTTIAAKERNSLENAVSNNEKNVDNKNLESTRDISTGNIFENEEISKNEYNIANKAVKDYESGEYAIATKEKAKAEKNLRKIKKDLNEANTKYPELCSKMAVISSKIDSMDSKITKSQSNYDFLESQCYSDDPFQNEYYSKLVGEMKVDLKKEKKVRDQYKKNLYNLDNSTNGEKGVLKDIENLGVASIEAEKALNEANARLQTAQKTLNELQQKKEEKREAWNVQKENIKNAENTFKDDEKTHNNKLEQAIKLKNDNRNPSTEIETVKKVLANNNPEIITETKKKIEEENWLD